MAEHCRLSNTYVSFLSLCLGLLLKTLLEDHQAYPQTLRLGDVMITVMI